MTYIRHLNMAVIGDEDLVSMLRLAGVSRYYVVEEKQDAGENVRKALTTLIANPDIGIVAIQEDHVKYVEDLLAQVKQQGKLTPVIIEVPSKYGAEYPDVAAHYRGYVRKFIGFDIEI